jgi:di/tricarboxylate transporter
MSETMQMIVVSVVLAGTFLCFVKEWIPTELAALSGFAALLAVGILDETDVGGVFGNAAPATIGAMFILSEALTRTGIIDGLATRFQSLARGSELRALVVLAIIVMPASAFLNNTPVVVVFLPVIIATCRSTGLKATRLLLPLSFLGILGGTMTLIGTSTNLLVSGKAAELGQDAFTIFEITPLGIVYAAVGSLYMVFVGRHLLPANDTVSSTLDVEDTRRFYSAIEIDVDSPLIGQRLVDSPLLAGEEKLSIYQVVRQGSRVRQPLNKITIRGNDVYWVRASTKRIAQAQVLPGVRLLRRHPDAEDAEETEPNSPERGDEDALNAGEVRIVEAIIGPESSLIGKTIRQSSLRQRFGILVAALHRSGRNMREDFENIPVTFGDTLILEGPTAGILRFHKQDNFLSLQELEVSPRLTGKAPLAIAALLGVVLCSAFGLLSITSAAIVGAVAVVLTRCLDIKSAFAAIDWKILFLIYGMLGVGRAMEKSGAAELVAKGVTGVLEPAGPYLILAAIYLLASILTELVTNNAVAIILTPIVIGIAGGLGIDARPFIVAIMFGASASFLTPIGYQTNTYVYGAGNYRFGDFVKVGLPLNLGLAAIATWLIPRFWPF